MLKPDQCIVKVTDLKAIFLLLCPIPPDFQEKYYFFTYRCSVLQFDQNLLIGASFTLGNP